MLPILSINITVFIVQFIKYFVLKFSDKFMKNKLNIE